MLLNTQKRMLSALLASAAMLSASMASAQSVDYSGLHALYGEPVTTSANGSPQKQSDVPLNMEIITAQDISRSGARSIPEILRFLPGLSVEQKTFAQTEVSIRGYNQNNAERILVLLNGRQVYTDFFGQVVWDNIPVEISEIKQIEVVKGPNTALFGFNAVSGVVNIITVNPLYDDLHAVEVRAGSHGFQEISGVTTHKLGDKVAFKFSTGGYKADKPFDVTPDVRDDVVRASLNLDVWAQVTDNVQAQLELTQNQNDRNEFLIASGANVHAQYDTNSVRGRVIADTGWGLWEADVYHNETQTNYALDTGSAVSPLEADNRITVAKLNNTFSMARDHIVRLSGEYRGASNIFAEVDGEDLRYHIMSGSGLWDWRVNDRLRTSAAVRFDSFEIGPDKSDNVAPNFPAGVTPYSRDDFVQKRNEFSYNLAAVYDLSDIETLRASLARGADLPSFTEFGLQFLTSPSAANPAGLATLGNPAVDTAIVHNFEAGYDRDIEEIDGLFRSAIFYQYNDELQGFGTTLSTTANYFGAGSDLDREFLGNIGDSEMYGFELGVEGKYQENWDWFVNYAYIHIDDDLRNKQNSAPFSSSAEYAASNVEHTLSAHLGYTAEKWHAGVFGQYRSARDGLISITNRNSSLRREPVNDHLIVNANFSYDLTDKISWSVSGTNLAGKTQQSADSDAETMIWSAVKLRF